MLLFEKEKNVTLKLIHQGAGEVILQKVLAKIIIANTNIKIIAAQYLAGYCIGNCFQFMN